MIERKPAPDQPFELGWPDEGPCIYCGARAVRLVSTLRKAHYECRGTPTNKHSAYGPDRCGRTFVVRDKENR